MKVLTETLGGSRYNLYARLAPKPFANAPYKAGERAALVNEIKALLEHRPTLWYRRATILLNRDRRRNGQRMLITNGFIG